MNVLFICKFNRFRSKIAEALFNKLNVDCKNKAKSAGIVKGNPVSRDVAKIAKNLGLKISIKPRKLTANLLKWSDLIVIVANNVSEKPFKNGLKKGKKIIVWKIKDCEENNRKEICKIIGQIKARVSGLKKFCSG